ncbi:MAG: hypothetical protein HZA53_06055, partial [Planctomycetes bacterium]|nr:hypothetical protein [Planctomycetota bacterium]
EFAGADLAAVALARGDANAIHAPVLVRAGAFELGHLAGGERVHLRLVVRGAEGASAKLSIRSLRAGAVELPIELR